MLFWRGAMRSPSSDQKGVSWSRHAGFFDPQREFLKNFCNLFQVSPPGSGRPAV
jgi:hypothetical protein